MARRLALVARANASVRSPLGASLASAHGRGDLCGATSRSHREFIQNSFARVSIDIG